MCDGRHIVFIHGVGLGHAVVVRLPFAGRPSSIHIMCIYKHRSKPICPSFQSHIIQAVERSSSATLLPRSAIVSCLSKEIFIFYLNLHWGKRSMCVPPIDCSRLWSSSFQLDRFRIVTRRNANLRRTDHMQETKSEVILWKPAVEG